MTNVSTPPSQDMFINTKNENLRAHTPKRKLRLESKLRKNLMNVHRNSKTRIIFILSIMWYKYFLNKVIIEKCSICTRNTLKIVKLVFYNYNTNKLRVILTKIFTPHSTTFSKHERLFKLFNKFVLFCKIYFL